uniref:Zinc finger protein 410-like n=1 Tax=Sinocyclocheilus rhinocerous TaxID=307959 RepID=A0A673KH99_9TELE
MLSDELDSKPELLVEFVQNASIPLGQSLEESDTKASCVSLLSSLCGPLELPESALSHAASPSLSDFGPERSPLVVQLQTPPPPAQTPPTILQDLQNHDSSSYVLLNLAKGMVASAEPLVFVQDDVDEAQEEVSAGDCADGSVPWYLRVQELAHDSLIAATRAQLARDARAGSNSDHIHSCQSEPRVGRAASEKVHRCSYENCHRTFTYPAHLKYHLKTHRNDRTFRCGAEGCGKSFYVLQRLQVHMRTHNGEKPFICSEKNCSKKFTTAGNLKNHRRTHTGTHTHTQTHTPTHTLTHRYRHTLTQTHTQTHTHTLRHTHTGTHTHTQTHTHSDTHTHRYTHSHTGTHTHTQIHTPVHIHRHTHTGTHTHSDTHTHTGTHTHRCARTHTLRHTHLHRYTHTGAQTCTHTHTLTHNKQ